MLSLRHAWAAYCASGPTMTWEKWLSVVRRGCPRDGWGVVEFDRDGGTVVVVETQEVPAVGWRCDGEEAWMPVDGEKYREKAA
jgi:hypothetical protein